MTLNTFLLKYHLVITDEMAGDLNKLIIELSKERSPLLRYIFNHEKRISLLEEKSKTK